MIQSKSSMPNSDRVAKFEGPDTSAQDEKDIENDMLNMASGMKEFANNFKTTFERDDKVLKKISRS